LVHIHWHTIFNTKFMARNTELRLRALTFIADAALGGGRKGARSKDQTLEMLHSSGENGLVCSKDLRKSFLGERVEMRAGMTPSSKSRFEMILSVKNTKCTTGAS